MEAYEAARDMGALTLATYLALTKLESEKRGGGGFAATLEEIAKEAGLNRKTVGKILGHLERKNMVKITSVSRQKTTYKLISSSSLRGTSLVPARDEDFVEIKKIDVHKRTSDVPDRDEVRPSQGQVYSVAKNRKIVISPDRRERLLKREDSEDSASATPLEAGAESYKKLRTKIWTEIELLENSDQ
jgi:DNA-binding CsgD family transcriptional regulator